MVASGPRRRLRGFGTILWALVPALSLGLLAAVPFVHAAVKLRGRVFAVSPTQELAAQPAMAAALAARQRREQARAVAARDPALARDLRIGRPDLPSEFDDGGLVDVNSVPAQVLVDRLGLSPTQAAQVVEARDRLGGFSGPEELTAFAELPEATVKVLGDRLLFLR